MINRPDGVAIWVSELNRSADSSLGLDGRRIYLYDTTLRDGEQAVGLVLNPDQKLELAHALDRLGVDRIEAGFPRVSPDDAQAIRLIAEAGLSAEIWGFARAVVDDVDALSDLGVIGCVIESPTSELKLKAYGLSREEVVDRTTRAVRRARENGLSVVYFAVDSTRTELDFLRQVYTAAIDAGAAEIAVVDTVGVCGPEAAEFLVRSVVGWLGESIPIHYHGHNDFGLATASAIAASRGGATWIHGTIDGVGERAGNANLGEVALALKAFYGASSGLKLEHLRETSRIMRRLAGYQHEPWKPLVGENLFVRESGAVASQFHDPPAIEPYGANLVGAERRLVLGKKSGIDSIRIKAGEMGLALTSEEEVQLLAAVKTAGIQGGGLIPDDRLLDFLNDLRSAGVS